VGTGAAAAAAAFSVSTAARAQRAPGKLETPQLKIGLAVDGTTFLPIYIAAAKTWQAEGIDAQLFVFRGDSEVSQALVGGSVDLHLASTTGLLNLVEAGQPVNAFYAGFDQADLAWLADPGIKRWNDLRGKTLGVSTFGSITDALTQYVLLKHGLTPNKDVQIVQAGGTASAFQALKSGKIAAAIMSSPGKWQAQDDGFTLLGTQASEVAPRWPKHVFISKKSFIAANPNTLTALLRAHVAAVRLAKTDRALAQQIMVDRLHYTPAFAQRAYDDVIGGFDERGRLPQRSMATFWQISIKNGDVHSVLPEKSFLDTSFIDSFPKWAPK
jgi:ABC-type nitrate/sulfonate/bicarbonate transport system substrate-binding protein